MNTITYEGVDAIKSKLLLDAEKSPYKRPTAIPIILFVIFLILNTTYFFLASNVLHRLTFQILHYTPKSIFSYLIVSYFICSVVCSIKF